MYKFDPKHDDDACYGERRMRRYPSYVITANHGDPLPQSTANNIPGPLATFVRSVHCYTDACVCYKTGIAAGAYVIGKGSPVAFVVDGVDSTIAELQAMLACLKAVEPLGEPITLHIDLPHIRYILARQRNAVRAELKQMVDRLNVHIVADGRSHAAYKQCHRAAGVMAGKQGLRHPDRLAMKAGKPLVVERVTTEKINRAILKQRQKQSEHDRIIQSQLAAAREQAKRVELKGGLATA